MDEIFLAEATASPLWTGEVAEVQHYSRGLQKAMHLYHPTPSVRTQ